MPSEVVVTLKGDGSAPWIVAHGETVPEATALLDAATAGEMFQAAAEASTLFAGAVRVANGVGQNAQPAQQQNYQGQPRNQVQPNQGYGQQQSQPPAYGQQDKPFNGTPHPEGKTCPMCGAGIVGKQPREKRMWTCPNQRSKGDGHYVEWIN